MFKIIKILENFKVNTGISRNMFKNLKSALIWLTDTFLDPCKLFFLNRLYSSFSFIAKLSGRYRDFPNAPFLVHIQQVFRVSHTCGTSVTIQERMLTHHH